MGAPELCYGKICAALTRDAHNPAVFTIMQKALQKVCPKCESVSTLHQEKTLVGTFSVILKTDGSFAALICAALTVSGAPMSLHLGLAAARGLGRGGA